MLPYLRHIPVLLLAGSWLATTLDAAQGEVTLASKDSNGLAGQRPSRDPAISADGRLVAFTSENYTFAPDNNGQPDVFVHDLDTGATELISMNATFGFAAQGTSSMPALSAAGRYVAFQSSAADLVLPHGNFATDIFVRDRQLGVTEVVSVDSLGNLGNGNCSNPSISGDGRFVAFQSWATNLVPVDLNGWQDVFLHDRLTGTTVCMSVDGAGLPANGFSIDPQVSADGSVVVFASTASDLVPGDTNATQDIFLYTVATGTVERVSLDESGGQVSGFSSEPSVSADGKLVLFTSSASDVVANDTNQADDLFLRNRGAAMTRRVSLTWQGHQADGDSDSGSLSADGRFAVFRSAATNFDYTDLDPTPDLFRVDLLSGIVRRFNADDSGLALSGIHLDPVLSADGSQAAFYSETQLDAADTNALGDVLHYGFAEASDLISLSGTSSGSPYDQFFTQWTGAVSFSMYRIYWSFHDTGSLLNGFAIDLGSPIHYATFGVHDVYGAGQWFGILPNLPGRTVHMEVVSWHNGEIHDSNLHSVTIL